MSTAGLLAIVLVALPALAFVLWPLLRRAAAPAGVLPITRDRYDELQEEKVALYRALRELEFDAQAGHLSRDDYDGLRARYEGRAAEVLRALDALGPAERPPEPQAARPAPGLRPARGWTRSPVALLAGAVVLVLFGLSLGLGLARYTEPDRSTGPAGGPPPMAMEPSPPGGRMPAADPSRPITSEMLRGMLDAAHQALDAGSYQQAIAAYQAILRRDPRNVEAITHLGIILAVAGHTDGALEAFDKALAIDPSYAHAWAEKARLLAEVKQDDAGAIRAWERFVALVPPGADRDRALRQIQEAKGRLAKTKR